MCKSLLFNISFTSGLVCCICWLFITVGQKINVYSVTWSAGFAYAKCQEHTCRVECGRRDSPVSLQQGLTTVNGLSSCSLVLVTLESYPPLSWESGSILAQGIFSGCDWSRMKPNLSGHLWMINADMGLRPALRKTWVALIN